MTKISTIGNRRLDPSFWSGRRVLITGHMGFKGSWLTSLLSRLGAHTFGYGQDDRSPLLYRELSFDNHISANGDINDLNSLRSTLAVAQPEILIHMAAQPIVLRSYQDPIETFTDNILGTANVLEAARGSHSLKAVIVVTSDKVYKNNEWPWAYRENDRLGGNDPYSASKAAAEIVVASMAKSFFSDPGTARVVTVRAGNVIGGGDWADFRLLPDAARAFANGRPLVIRNPLSTRPWQHVLDPLSGYLMLAEDLLGADAPPSEAWNFGPSSEEVLPVSDVADLFVEAWGGSAAWQEENPSVPKKHEAHLLNVDSSLSRQILRWEPTWKVRESITRTAAWYRDHAMGAPAHSLVDRDVEAYLN